MDVALCPDSPRDLSMPIEYQLEQCKVSKEQRPRFDSIFGEVEEKPKFKAYKPEETYENNPFTKNLIQRLGPEFDPKNLINKNKKMFEKMSMMNGFAICADVEYEHTYLDRIKIDNQNQMDNGRP